MFALSALLAQLVTLTLGDRIQGFTIANDQTQHFEATNTTGAALILSLDRRRRKVSLGYAPSFTFVRLVREPRDLLIEHSGFVAGEYRWRDTTAAVSTTVTYGERDFQQEAILPKRPTEPDPQQPSPGQGGQTPQQGGGGGQPGADGGTSSSTTAAPPAFSSRPVAFATLQTQGGLAYALTGRTTLSVAGGYSLSGGVDREAQRSFPLSRGPNGNANVRYVMDNRNSFVTGATAQLMFNQNGSNGFIATISEDYNHVFARRTAGTLGVGIAYTRSQPFYGLRLPLHSIFPTARAGLTHAERLAQGTLALSLTLSSSPVLDTTTAAVDPRVGGTLSSGWSRDRFALNATMASSISVARDRVNAFDAIFASISANYNLGAGFAVDAGVNASWQRYAHDTLIDPSLAFLVGLSFAFATQHDFRR
jgi:hypothetical protein